MHGLPQVLHEHGAAQLPHCYNGRRLYQGVCSGLLHLS